MSFKEDGRARALVSFKEDGRARAIGIANFPLALLREVVEVMHAPLTAMQVEYHVALSLAKLPDFARQHDMALIACSPLAGNKVSEMPEIRRIADKHGVQPTQVALKWLIDQEPCPGRAEGPVNSRIWHHAMCSPMMRISR